MLVVEIKTYMVVLNLINTHINAYAQGLMVLLRDFQMLLFKQSVIYDFLKILLQVIPFLLKGLLL